MSVIAIRNSQYGIEIACDSCTSYGDLQITRGTQLANTKMWITEPGCILGSVGDASLGDVLRRWSIANTPDGPGEQEMFRYCDQFHEWRIERFGEAGGIDDFSALIAYQGHVWLMDGYSISEVPAGGYMAQGSGMAVALGAMHCGATVRQAVEAACTHQENCRGPVMVAYMRPNGSIDQLSSNVDIAGATRVWA